MIKSKHIILNYKITYKIFNFIILTKKKNIYFSVSRNYIKNIFKKINFFFLSKLFGFFFIYFLKNLNYKNFCLKKYNSKILFLELFKIINNFLLFLK